MDLQSNAFQRAVDVLERLGDSELLDTYKRYAARLEATVGAGWLDTYASMYQRDRRSFTHQDAGSLASPEEIAVRDRAVGDPELANLYQRVIAALAQRKLLDERYVG